MAVDEPEADPSDPNKVYVYFTALVSRTLRQHAKSVTPVALAAVEG